MIVRWLSPLLACVVFVLVLLGGTVHTQGASLACPDWPLCYGLVFPPMEGDILLEHSHRLLATFVGLLTLVQWGLIMRAGGHLRARFAWPAAAGIGLVVAQGVLGGLTVLYRLPPPISIAHWSLSMVFFAWAVGMAVLLRRATSLSPSRLSQRQVPLPGQSLVWAAAIAVWLQGVLGASVRHTHSSLSCGATWLGCGDGLWPLTGPQWLQTSHRLVALVVFLLVGGGTVPALRAAKQAGAGLTRRLGRAAHVLVAAQMVFGALTLSTGIHLHVVLTHVACGALLFVVLVAMALSMGPDAHESALQASASAVAERERAA